MGAMTTLITDGGRYEISKKGADLLRSLFIKQHESEPYHQHQNKAEQRYGVVKRYINTLMNLTGAPSSLLVAMYAVCMPSSECYSISCPGRPYSSPGSDWESP